MHTLKRPLCKIRDGAGLSVPVSYTHLDVYKRQHRKWVGVDNVIILENLRFIAANDKSYHIRIPLIEGVNTTDENISATIDFIKSLERVPDRVGLLPYHNIATNKYEKLGRIYDDKGLSAPTKERQLEILNTFIDNGFDAVIGG